jgi:hypothetical protein
VASQFLNVTQLINEVLSRLGVLSQGQATDPEDFSYVQLMVEPTLARLNSLEVVPVADENNIPLEWYESLADILAEACAAKFNVSLEDMTALASRGMGGPPSQVPFMAGTAVLALKQQQRLRATYEMARSIYF